MVPMMAGRGATLALLTLVMRVWSVAGNDAQISSADDSEGHLKMPQLRILHKLVDGDADGKVSVGELVNFSKNMQKQVAAHQGGAAFEELDTDMDGQISMEEALKEMDEWEDEGTKEEDAQAPAKRRERERQKFKAADADKNGVLNAQELASLLHSAHHDGVLEVEARHLLEHRDKDGDGLLSPREFWHIPDDEEMPGVNDDRFKRFDRDASGKLDLAELKEFESGGHEAEDAMRELVRLADTDGDLHLTDKELAYANKKILDKDAHSHLSQWWDHRELVASGSSLSLRKQSEL